MLSEQSDGKTVETKEEVLKTHRRIILILTLLLIVMSLTFTFKMISDIENQKRGEDIISSAQKEAKQIVNKAEVDASIIVHTATTDANEKAATITQAAEAKANTITKNAENNANNIVDKAINTKIDDVETLLAITEAEAGDQPVEGRAAVAATIKNRIASEEFKADSIKDVVYAPGQFDPVSNGTISRVSITPSTIEGVKLCLEGNDYSNGALYFYNPDISSNNSVRWFRTLKTTAIIGDHVFKK